jgi:hypothetical protein
LEWNLGAMIINGDLIVVVGVLTFREFIQGFVNVDDELFGKFSRLI